MVSFRLSAQKTVDLFRILDYSKISTLAETPPTTRADSPLPTPIKEGWGRLIGGLNALTRIGRRYGIYGARYP